ncbi:hypothetical protein NLI96_g9674 [Meripilus lineatus]|uniref:Cytochrome P450 n=1 Tax=Meripilus lineatus TaxID=2056292 RepID=A0AAD5UX92_9APHY|nr:hypothetical protein NLI96_g9674 [Physisporinus lineatus]
MLQIIALFALLLVYLWRLFKTRRLSRFDHEPPIVVSLLPCVGAALELAYDSFKFTHKCWEKYGPSFRIPIKTGHVTVFCNEDGLRDVFRDKTRAFNVLTGHRLGLRLIGGIKEETQAVHLLDEHLNPLVARAFSTTSGLESIIPAFNEKLGKHIFDQVKELGSSTRDVPVVSFVSEALYSSASTAVFGDLFPIDTYHDFMLLDEHFSRLMFPLPFFTRRVLQARGRLLNSITSYVQSAWKNTHIEKGPPVASEIVATLKATDLSDLDQAGLILSFMWGMHANTIRVATWLFMHLLNHRDSFDRVRTEIDSTINSIYGGDLKSFLETPYSSLRHDEFPLLDSAIKETLRLAVLFGNIREAHKDVEVEYGDGKRAYIPKGELVLLNLGTYYRDEGVCRDGGDFRLDRFISGEGAPTFWPFGGGTHMVNESAHETLSSN